MKNPKTVHRNPCFYLYNGNYKVSWGRKRVSVVGYLVAMQINECFQLGTTEYSLMSLAQQEI